MSDDIKEIEIVSEIGKGSFGNVFKATWNRKQLSKEVAVKVFPLDVPQSESAFEAEVRMGVLLKDCPHCVTIKKAYITDNKGYLVMDLFHGDLFSIQPKLKFNEAKTSPVFKQICLAIHKLHAKRTVHLDIKPDNILLDQNENVFLADFGSSAIVPPGAKFKAATGTENYAAPEVLKGEAYCPFAADIWSLGVMLYSILTEKYPKVKKGYSPHRKLSDSCNDLLSSMLQKTPQTRATISRVLEHPWVIGTTVEPKPSPVIKSRKTKTK